jgi:hypothetical protein
MAAKIACSTSDFLKNTGSNSALLPGAPVMIIACNKNLKFTLEDLEDAVAYITEHAHALGGGLCFAKALQSFNGVSSLAFISVDANGRWFVKKNSDGTFSGMPAAQVSAPKIGTADFKNLARTNFSISYDPISYVNGKLIVTDAGTEVIDITGLIDVNVMEGDSAATTSHLYVKLVDDCCGDDVASILGAGLLFPDNFLVTDKATGLPVTITGVTIIGEEVALAGTFVSGHTYVVAGSDGNSETLFGHGTEGFEITEPVEITVP